MLASLLLNRARLSLRHAIGARAPVAPPSAQDRKRLEVCWSAGLGLGVSDMLRAAEFQTRHALLALRSGEFDKAAQAFTSFIGRWPASGYAPTARYWQGNALYGKRDYREAINAFRMFLAKAPGSERAGEAMLAIANSQAEMKDKAGARKTLEDLIKAYPKSEAAVAAKERLAALK